MLVQERLNGFDVAIEALDSQKLMPPLMIRAVWNDAILDGIGFECSNAHPMAGTVRAIAMCLEHDNGHRFRALGTTDYARLQYVAEREQQGQHAVQAHTRIPLHDGQHHHRQATENQHAGADNEGTAHQLVAHFVAPSGRASTGQGSRVRPMR